MYPRSLRPSPNAASVTSTLTRCSRADDLIVSQPITGIVGCCARAARAAERFVTAPYRFDVLDGVSHWISEGAPERVAALIVGWLGEW